MKISLNKLSQKVGDQRRKVAALQEKRAKAIEAYSEASDATQGIESKIEAEESPSDELKQSLDKSREKATELRKSVASIGNEIAKETKQLADDEQDLAMAQEHNQVEDQLQSSTGNPGGRPDPGEKDETGRGSQTRVMPASRDQMMHDMGVAFQCTLIAAADGGNAVDVANNMFQNERVAQALTANSHSAGGSWVQGAFSDMFIDLLRPESIVRAAGVDSVPLDDGTLTMPKTLSGPSGRYLGEDEAANAETVTTGDLMLVGKELVVIVPISEKLARSPSANASARVRNTIFAGAGETEDLHFIRGVASGAGPTGMRYLLNSANLLTANTTITLANVTFDLGRCELALLAGNVKMRKPAWFMSPRSLVFLMDLRDGNGNLAFPSLSGERPMLRNKPVYTTTQIPDNIGGNGTGSEIYLADASELIIGDVPKVDFIADSRAAYNDASGNIKSALSERKIVMRLVVENDFGLLHDKAVAVLNDVRWGYTS